MKTNDLPRPPAILTAIAALLFCAYAATPATAQDKTEKKVTAAPSKTKNEQSVTVTAKSDPNDKDGKYKIHIVKDKNGKKTVIDTVLISDHGLDGKDLDRMMEDMHSQMKDVEKQMKDIEIYIGSTNDSLDTDSSGHHRYAFKFNGKSCCPNIDFRDLPHNFNYNFELPEVPEVPEGFENEFFNQGIRSPHMITMPKNGESLSDVLGDIPMSRVKSYKIIDKKGGKRIVIDLEDGPGFGGNQNVIYLNSPRHMSRQQRGHQKDARIIIRSDDHDGPGSPDSPAAPSEPAKPQPETPKI